MDQGKSKDKTPEEIETDKRKEGVRLKRKAEEERRVGLFTACRAGFVEEVRVCVCVCGRAFWLALAEKTQHQPCST